MREMMFEYNTLVVKAEWKILFTSPRSKSDDNIKIEFIKIG
jgi:hypothetical protein